MRSAALSASWLARAPVSAVAAPEATTTPATAPGKVEWVRDSVRKMRRSSSASAPTSPASSPMTSASVRGRASSCQLTLMRPPPSGASGRRPPPGGRRP